MKFVKCALVCILLILCSKILGAYNKGHHLILFVVECVRCNAVMHLLSEWYLIDENYGMSKTMNLD